MESYTFLKYCNNKNVNHINKKDIEKYILYRRKNNKPKTVHSDSMDLRLFFKWLNPESDFFENIKVIEPLSCPCEIVPQKLMNSRT
ncbi:phage integrase N-terminal SAM-like domain-containing protein [Methanolobus sediminis]|uniref:Phage integrase N-terminal SAM-like domain-containing protein n=1 Tax=Methanolobus sediminis TaxID=3072978 RepID=A0AA51YKY6_9EURY|nr:phage integrase N-terminal SAM-like domain-containing protein [Methanolobus sediminis]WMW24387.1 phage integrase N-terminal SAM-like domain-containing protein [Methanolobus sediminis]